MRSMAQAAYAATCFCSLISASQKPTKVSATECSMAPSRAKRSAHALPRKTSGCLPSAA